MGPKVTQEKMAGMIGVSREVYINTVLGRKARGKFLKTTPQARYRVFFERFMRQHEAGIRKAVEELADNGSRQDDIRNLRDNEGYREAV
jgi:hypothetical protein